MPTDAGKSCDVKLEAVAQAIAEADHRPMVWELRSQQSRDEYRAAATAAVAVRDDQWRVRLTKRAEHFDTVDRAESTPDHVAPARWIADELRRLVAESEAS